MFGEDADQNEVEASNEGRIGRAALVADEGSDTQEFDMLPSIDATSQITGLIKRPRKPPKSATIRTEAHDIIVISDESDVEVREGDGLRSRLVRQRRRRDNDAGSSAAAAMKCTPLQARSITQPIGKVLTKPMIFKDERTRKMVQQCIKTAEQLLSLQIAELQAEQCML